MEDEIFKFRRERARDIYEDRGYSTRGFAKLAELGSHAEVMRYLNEKQPKGKKPKDITTSVLNKFLKAFKISRERFEQTDTVMLVAKLKHLLDTGENPKQALDLAVRYADLAVGIHEKSEAYGLLGKAYYELDMQDETHDTVAASYELALKGNDIELLFNATNKLLHSLYSKKMHEECTKLLDWAESTFNNDIKKIGTFLHFRGLLSSRQGEFKVSKEKYQQAYAIYKVLEDKILMGRAEINLAHHEYHDGNYDAAKEYLVSACSLLENDTITMRVIAWMNLSRALLRLGQREEAHEIIDTQLRLLQKSDLSRSELLGKLLLMKADVTGNVQFAEEILNLGIADDEFKCATLDFLAKKYIELGDKDNALKYYTLMIEYSGVVPKDYKAGRWF